MIGPRMPERTEPAASRRPSSLAALAMAILSELSSSPRVTVRRPGPPDPDGRAVVYWMQRAQRASDNPALDVAIDAANALRLPVVAFFGLTPAYPNANRRHYAVPGRRPAGHRAGPARRAASASCSAAIRTMTSPGSATTRGAALVVGDENPLREPERWRRDAAARAARAVLDGRRRRHRALGAAGQGAVRRADDPAAAAPADPAVPRARTRSRARAWRGAPRRRRPACPRPSRRSTGSTSTTPRGPGRGVPGRAGRGPARAGAIPPRAAPRVRRRAEPPGARRARASSRPISTSATSGRARWRGPCATPTRRARIATRFSRSSSSGASWR